MPLIFAKQIFQSGVTSHCVAKFHMLKGVFRKKNGRFFVKIYRFFGAGGRGRTDTVLLPRDFESRTSANSITPAKILLKYNIIFKTTLQEFF